jgi:2-polyprenyl-3-methyl-5-hydroxy-6-metoxy-1,4-benzoquinol methylase
VSAAAYAPDLDFDRHYTAAATRRILPFLRPGDRVLELGCATGAMTAALAERCFWVDGVDLGASYLAAARARDIVNAGFHLRSAETPPLGRYDHVVMTSLLGEVDDPGALFEVAASRLGPGGLVHVTSNNPRSLHRLLAVEMGLIGDEAALSDRNTAFGVRRLLSAQELRTLAAAAGLVELHREGIMAKPLTNEQLAVLPEDVIAGLDRLVRHLPEHGAMTYAIYAPSADA